MAASTGELKGRRKAAALLITIGKQRSPDVLRHLDDDDIERLTWEISALGELSPDHRHTVIENFEDTARSHNVDLSEQFTSMIIAQRGFQSSARVTSAADQMLQDLVALIR